MLFNTPTYIAFFCIVAVLFYLTNRKRTLIARNLLLLVASYYFYATLHIWYIILLVYITIVNYGCGWWIHQRQKEGKKGREAVTTAILLSIGILAFFKYAHLYEASLWLPVGLSFFTFQALTYSIDIYRKKSNANRNLLEVALFVSFFPTLLSGPIERGRNLIPQLQKVTPTQWNNITTGCQLFIWGLFKKVVIADRLAEYVNSVYYNPDAHTGSTLALAAVFYSFQIYCDFSGYADMAIGSGKALSFNLMKNFNLPYCANTFKEFWHRWHISLTTWFTEYVYISMGGNRVSKLRWLGNISTIFLLSGIWHGATWSFILWGGIHAMLYLGEHFFGPKKPNILYHLFVFVMITFAWIFFRTEDSGTAWSIISTICTDLNTPVYWGSSTFSTLIAILLVVFLIIREYLMFKNITVPGKSVGYVLLLVGIALLGVSSSQFVYFQF